jgi:hypothetical protein
VGEGDYEDTVHAEGEWPTNHALADRTPPLSPHAVSLALGDQILRLRTELTKQGLDAGADTIPSHLLACSG